jgi:hypothetical protein
VMLHGSLIARAVGFHQRGDGGASFKLGPAEFRG